MNAIEKITAHVNDIRTQLESGAKTAEEAAAEVALIREALADMRDAIENKPAIYTNRAARRARAKAERTRA